MKRLLLILALIIACAINLLADEVKSIDVSTTIKEVTVFKNACQITRTQTVSLQKGTSTLKFTGLSPFLDKSSIRVKMNKEAVILSINFELNYKKTDDAKTKQLNAFKDEILKIDEKINIEQTKKVVINDELSFFAKNMAIAGTEGIQAAQIKEIHKFYSEKTSELRLATLEIDKKIKQLQEEKSKIGDEYSKLLNENTYPEGELFVKLDAPNAGSFVFEISYTASNASWTPMYDIVAKDTNKPIELVYKAEVKQNTKEDWKDVKVRLSSSNPQKIKGKTELVPYRLNYNYKGVSYTTNDDAVTSGAGTLQGRIIDTDTKEPIAFANVVVLVGALQKGGAQTDFDGNYTIKAISAGVYDVVISCVGYQKQTITGVRVTPNQIAFCDVKLVAATIGLEGIEVMSYSVPLIQKDKTTVGGTFSRGGEDFSIRGQRSEGSVYYIDGIKVTGGTTQSKADPNRVYNNVTPTIQLESSTYFEFEIKSPYSIPSDDKNYTILIDEFSIPTTYKHFTVPKISLDAYLIAEMTNWSNYKLLPGNSNIFFENTFIGKSYIDTNNTSDTLEIFLGKDNGIIVKRDLEKTLSTTSTFGNKIEETKTWKLSVRNNKSKAATLSIYDQIPISTNSDISVKTLNISNGKLDDTSGEVVWNIDLAPSESKNFELKYSVRYPAGRRLLVE